MPKSRRIKKSSNKTRSNRGYFQQFQKEVTVIFLEMLMMVKLYHWKTFSYATHKATDELYSKLNENIDRFMEILLGKSGQRTDLMNHKNIRLFDLNSPESLKKKVEEFKTYLVDLDYKEQLKKMSNADLYTVRDEILADMNQFLYLLTFK
jgi:DNA-binding ferritin-like protein